MTRPTALRRFLACACLLTAVSSCVGPSRTERDFANKAANTAESVASAVNTARVAVEQAARQRTFGPYLSVLLRNAEEDANAAQQSFDAVQPPDAAADALREALDLLVDDVTGVLDDLRIAARRGEFDRLTTIAAPLDGLSRHLDDFEVAHG
ncbi:MAG: hypothetical protein ABR520_10160 [Mycobacteriales bacterium]